MTYQRPAVSRVLAVSLCIGALAMAGCDKTNTAAAPSAQDAASQPATAASQAPAAVAAPVPTAYTPPTAEQLYQLVAPIALYPDQLVAQVLAGATYPDQITAVRDWLAQNSALKAGPLADAANQQPWDPSVKSLTAFRPVLDQMAGNLPWTEALGRAYYNDPADVLNAIQVMRQRASKAGHLKNTGKLRVASAAVPLNYTPAPDMQPLYAGPAVIEPPAELITIEPAQPDVVYVPAYDPQAIYGAPVPVYPGYAYAPPVVAAPGYSGGQLVAAGALSFGLGVVVGAALEHHDWGWHAWNMNWGAPGRRDRGAPPPAFRPAVVYNNNTYISRSTTVVNNVRSVYNNNGGTPRGLPAPAAPHVAATPGFAPQSQPPQAALAQQQARQQEALLRQQQMQQQAQQHAQQQAQQQQHLRQAQLQQQQQDPLRRQQAQQQVRTQQPAQQMQQQHVLAQQQRQQQAQQLEQSKRQQMQQLQAQNQARQQQAQQDQMRRQQQQAQQQARQMQMQHQQQAQQQVQQRAAAAAAAAHHPRPGEPGQQHP